MNTCDYGHQTKDEIRSMPFSNGNLLLCHRHYLKECVAYPEGKPAWESLTIYERKIDTTYEGWRNRQTWNCALWINNEYWLYKAAVEWMTNHRNSKHPYSQFIRSMGMSEEKTGDGYKWLSTRLDYKALDDMMRELISG